MDEIERAHAGDRDAMRALGEHLLPVIQASVARRLYPLARARGRDPKTERDDLVSGVWVRLFENDWKVLRGFDPARGGLEGYVMTIADRHVLGVFRIKSRDPYGEIPMSNTTPVSNQSSA
jgi:DNA-directed RNA polymerase specialized sigma24 family protein